MTQQKTWNASSGVTTEFIELNPEELHLVGTGANGFAPLLAKAAAAVDAVLSEADTNTGQEDAEKAMAEPIDESLSQTREEEGKHGAVSMANGHEEGDPPVLSTPLMGPTTVGPHDGEGTTAPDKSIPKAEALSMTKQDATAIVDMTGTKQGPADDAPAKAEALTQTAENARKADADNDADDAEDDDEDDAPAKKAAAALKQALKELEGKKDVGEINQIINRATEGLSGLVDGAVSNQVATKGIEDMTTDELMKLLDERDARKEAERTKAEKETAELAKASQAKSEEAAPEAVKSEKEETIAVSKSEWESLVKRVEDIANQPAAPRVAINGEGVRAAEARQGGPDAFSQLRKEIGEETDPRRLAAKKDELAKGIFMLNERVRLTQPPVVRQGEGVPLFAPNPAATGRPLG